MAFAQPMEVTTTPSESDPTETSPGNFSKSILLPRDRTTERDLQSIVAAISTENWTSVAQVLHRLMTVLARNPSDSNVSDLVELDGIVCSIDVAISRVYERLPATGRAVVLRLVEPIAKEELAAAVRAQNAPAIQQVARRYRFTNAGEQARDLYRQLLHDQGRFLSGGNAQNPTGKNDDTVKNDDTEIRNGWSHSVETDPVTRQTVDKAYRFLRQSGANPFPTANLIGSGHVLLASLAGERVALEPQTGKVLWSRPVPGYGAEWYLLPGNLGDANRARLFTLAVARRVFGEAVYASAAMDDSRCFFLESTMDEVVPVDDSSEASSTRNEFTHPFPANRLVCVDQRTGETLWTLPSAPEHSIFYAGTPVVSDGALWILGESRDTQAMTLYQYDAATGGLMDSLNVAQAKLSISNDARRQEIDCQVVIDGDQVICPTAAGGLFAVDRLTGDMLWAHRFARNDAIELPQDGETPLHRSGFGHWDGWQGIQLFPVDQLLVVVSPEQDHVLVVDKRLGKRLWSVECPAGLHVACADSIHGVVVVSKSTVDAYDLTSGKPIWSAMIPHPAGRGVFGNNINTAGLTSRGLKAEGKPSSGNLSYLFPILMNGVASLDLRTGVVETDLASVSAFTSPDEVLPVSMWPRRLVQVGSLLYEVRANSVVQLGNVKNGGLNESLDSLVQTVRQQFRSGNNSAAMQLLNDDIQSNSEDPTRRRTALSLLREQLFQTKNVEEHKEFVTAMERFPLSPAERTSWKREQAESALQHQDFASFATCWLLATDEELESLLTAPDQNSRVRFDRWFQQTARQVAASHPVQLHEAMHQALTLAQKDWEPAEQQRQTHQRQTHRLAKRLGQTPWGNSLRITEIPEFPEIRDLLAYQFALKIQAETADPQFAAGAAYRLFQLYQQRDCELDAVRWLNHLGRFDPDLRLPDGFTVSEVCSAAVPEFQRMIDTASHLALWPEGSPQTEAKTRISREVYLVPMKVPDFMETGFERLAVELDYPARQAVRFSGSRWPRAWYCQLPVDIRKAHLEEHLDRCVGIEQMLIVQSGTSLFGVSPFDLSGKPRARLIWPSAEDSGETLGERDVFTLTALNEALPDRPGFSSPVLRRLDEFYHPVASVGPVRAGYVCRQQQGMLVAIDTATGEELWRRYDLPRRSECYGDDEQVAVVSAEEGDIFFYSAIDGRLLHTRPRTYQPDDVVAAQGFDLMLIQGDLQSSTSLYDGDRESQPSASVLSDVIVRRLNLQSGKTHWERRWESRSLPFEVDERWMGILTPGNQVELFDQQTGNTVSTHTMEFPNPVERVYSTVFDTDVLLMFSEPVENLRYRRLSQIRGGYRRPWVKGKLVCIDRETGALRWTLTLEETELPLDQPPELPVVITAEYRSPGYSSDITATEEEMEEVTEPEPMKEEIPEKSGVIIRCYDRRSGNLLHEIHDADETLPSYTILGNRLKRSVQVQTLRTRLDLNYSSVP
ncbi:MAG TPA: PQQ-binding-like beta-propeller repeat protein [Planctomicrobium sp.]|nr:PQQ-binding-like beta-propeller repeat protein [Planctomicrobium sp.]